jgi:hypothetical protein
MPLTSHGKSMDTAEGRCVKCKKQREFRVTGFSVWKNGMEAATGTCPVCDTKMNRILGKAKN